MHCGVETSITSGEKRGAMRDALKALEDSGQTIIVERVDDGSDPNVVEFRGHLVDQPSTKALIRRSQGGTRQEARE